MSRLGGSLNEADGTILRGLEFFRRGRGLESLNEADQTILRGVETPS